MNRTYGAKYASMGDKYLPAADIAKLMRADIKKMIDTGTLPGTTKNYSVRVHNYSGGRSINIRAKDLPGMWQTCTGIVPGSEDGYSARACRDVWCKGLDLPEYRHAAHTHLTLSVDGQRVRKLLQTVHDAYNYDGSDSMTDYFDVNYYGTVDVDGQYGA